MTSLENRSRTALVVIDAQNGVIGKAFERDRVIANIATLLDKARAEDALAVQAEAVNRLMNIPEDQRRNEDVRALRQALGFTLSVVTAASPETGFHLMEELAALPDADIIWIVRENMKKTRLQPWQDRLQTLEIALFRPEEADVD